MQKLQKFILVFIILGITLAFNPFLSTEVFEWPKLMLLLISVAVFSLVNIVDWVFCKSDIRICHSRASGKPENIANNQDLNFHRNDNVTRGFFGKVRPELIFVHLFLIGNIIAFIYSTDRATSLLGSPIRFQGFLTQIYYVLFGVNVWYALSRSGLDFTRLSKSLFRWLTILLVVVCLLAMAPYVFPDAFYFFTPKLFFDRVYGPLGNPNYLAAVIVALLPILLLTGKTVFIGRLVKTLYWPALVLVVVTLFYTGSRGAWLATIIGLFFYSLLEVVRRKQAKKLLLVLGVIVLVVVGVTLKSRLATIAPQFERLSLDTPTSNSIRSRLIFWQVGLKMALARPLTGYGQDMVAVNVEPYLPAYLQSNDIFYVDRLHNEFIDILVMQGGLGFVGYAGLLIVIWFSAFKKFWQVSEPKEQTVYVSTTLLAALILTMFHAINFSTISSNVLLVFLLVYILVAKSQSA